MTSLLSSFKVHNIINTNQSMFLLALSNNIKQMNNIEEVYTIDIGDDTGTYSVVGSIHLHYEKENVSFIFYLVIFSFK